MSTLIFRWFSKGRGVGAETKIGGDSMAEIRGESFPIPSEKGTHIFISPRAGPDRIETGDGRFVVPDYQERGNPPTGKEVWRMGACRAAQGWNAAILRQGGFDCNRWPASSRSGEHSAYVRNRAATISAGRGHKSPNESLGKEDVPARPPTEAAGYAGLSAARKPSSGKVRERGPRQYRSLNLPMWIQSLRLDDDFWPDQGGGRRPVDWGYRNVSGPCAITSDAVRDQAGPERSNPRPLLVVRRMAGYGQDQTCWCRAVIPAC